MKIAVPAEADKDETRVAATPDTVKKFVAIGAEVTVETGAGLRSAITDAIASSVAAVIDTRVEVLAVVNAGECAHSPKPVSQPSRLVHIGVRGAHAPARSIHTRRASACVARARRGEKSRLRH